MNKLTDLVISNTPIELHNVSGYKVFVKREDLSARLPMPPFSKVRGLAEALDKMKQNGVQTVGYCETAISMAGIGVAVGCYYLNLNCVIFNPIYKKTPETLMRHRKYWKKFNVKIVDIPASRAKINWYISKNKLKQDFGTDAVMLPLGIPFPETVEETAKEFNRTEGYYNTVIVNIGSGTICAGILKGMTSGTLIGVMGRTGNVMSKRIKIIRLAESPERMTTINFKVIDPGYNYMDSLNFPCPFPTNSFYDLKAWKWLVENIDQFEKPVLFWNIGAEI